MWSLILSDISFKVVFVVFMSSLSPLMSLHCTGSLSLSILIITNVIGDVDSMQQIKIPRMMRDVDWFTNTCTIAYSLIGKSEAFICNSCSCIHTSL